MAENSTAGSPLISIVTVCYNEPPAKVRKTFESIASQDYPRIEWIVVDGGSCEETLSAIQEFSAKIATLISEPDNGVYDAMNKGIERAGGDFISFMNVGDQFLSSNVISTLADSIATHPDHDCYYGDVIYVDEDGQPIFKVYQPRKINLARLYTRTVCHQAILAKRSLYKVTGNFDLQYRIVADRDWIIRTLKAGASWFYTGVMICEYDARGMSSDVKKRQAEVARLLRRSFPLWKRSFLYMQWKATKIIARLTASKNDKPGEIHL